MKMKRLLLLIGVVLVIFLLIFFATKKIAKESTDQDSVMNEANLTKTTAEVITSNDIDKTDNLTKEMEIVSEDNEIVIEPEKIVLDVFRADYKDFSNYITPLEQVIEKYDSEENAALMQDIFEIISNDLDTAERITDAVSESDFLNLSLEEKSSSLDRLGFNLIMSPYVLARLYSNFSPDLQAAVNRNWESEIIKEPVILKQVYEIESQNTEYEFKSKSPNNKYYKVIMEFVDKESELYKKQGNYAIYMFINKTAKHAEIEYVFCVDEKDILNRSPLAGSFSLKDL